MIIESMSIADIKCKIQTALPAELEALLPILQADQRSGVQQLAIQSQKRIAIEHKRQLHWESLNQEERKLRKQGYTYIAGVDEVGRGPLAGPVVTAAVILPADFELVGINDSKQLKKEVREEYATVIKEKAVCYSVSFVEAQEIDRINIYQATLLAMKQAIESCSTVPEYCLIDAMKPSISIPYTSLIKGDAKSVSIAAASILAKVARDDWMIQMAQLYPQYGFDRHMGYATPEHQKAIRQFGATPIHRRTFLQNQACLDL